MAGASVETWIRARPGGVVRAKGLVRVADRPDDRTVLQVCGSNSTVTVDGSWDGGNLVVVAIALPGTPRAALVKWLNLLALDWFPSPAVVNLPVCTGQVSRSDRSGPTQPETPT